MLTKAYLTYPMLKSIARLPQERDLMIKTCKRRPWSDPQTLGQEMYVILLQFSAHKGLAAGLEAPWGGCCEDWTGRAMIYWHISTPCLAREFWAGQVLARAGLDEVRDYSVVPISRSWAMLADCRGCSWSVGICGGAIHRAAGMWGHGVNRFMERLAFLYSSFPFYFILYVFLTSVRITAKQQYFRSAYIPFSTSLGICRTGHNYTCQW